MQKTDFETLLFSLYLERILDMSEGGYIDIQLNTSVLQVSPEYFVDRMLPASPESEREGIRAKLKARSSGTMEDTE